MAAIAVPAAAIEADFTGFLQARGFTHKNLAADGARANGVDQRFRLWTNTALHENVKAVFAIEVDNVWGADTTATDTNLPTAVRGGVGRVGADATSQIEIKHLYLDFNVPFASTNIKAGAQYFKLGGGFIQGDDASGLQVRYTPIQGQSLLFSWVKMNEGDVFTSRDDGDYYHLQYDTEVAGWRVSPFVGYMEGAPTGLGLSGFSNRFDAWFVGAEASGKVGPLGIAAAAIVNFWDNDVAVTGTTVDDGMGLALWARATYAMGPTTLMAEGAFYGDDEAGTFINVRGYNNYAEVITGGRFDSRSAMGGTPVTPAPAAAGARNDYNMNHLYAKLGAEHKYDDKHKVSAYYIWARQAADAFGADRVDFGHEVDLYYDYAITKGMNFTVGGGWLFADSDFRDSDAWKVGTALTYTF